MRWCETLWKWDNWMLCWLGYLWPWIFKVKLYLGIGGPIVMEWKEQESIACPDVKHDLYVTPRQRILLPTGWLQMSAFPSTRLFFIYFLATWCSMITQDWRNPLRPRTTYVGVNIGSCNWRQQAITRPNDDLSSVRSSDFHLRAISLKIPKSSIT